MLSWLAENLATVLISAVLLIAVGLIVAARIRKKQPRRPSCGATCGCGSMSGSCDKK